MATTLFFFWGHQAVANIVDATLAANLLAPHPFRGLFAARFLVHIFDNFAVNQGVGASGIDFFQQGVPGGLTAEERRDYLILISLQEAIDRLASAEFSDAYGGSTNIRDYRWGKVQRLTIVHAFDQVPALPDIRNIPPAGGFNDVSPTLPGFARGGTRGTINVAEGSFNIISPASLEYRFGPSLRRVLTAKKWGIYSKSILPGGQSGDVNDPLYSNQVGRWLVGEYKPAKTKPPGIIFGTKKVILLIPKK